MPSGANAGSSSGGGAPTGSAGGSLTGTYPDPTIATIPSGATATTQTAADGSTKVATTAYVDTADALKANLAGPTFTGVVTLPTGTVATTQSASDNSTKLGTTAYIDTADALKANLAGPTFTGVVTLPTGTVATTQTSSDSSTKLATTAFTKAQYPTSPDRIHANAGLFINVNSSPTGAKPPTLLKPLFYPINIGGYPSMVVADISNKIQTGNGGSVFGAAIYSIVWTGVNYAATLVCQSNATASMTTAAVVNSPVTTGAAGSGAVAATLDFTANKYIVGVMASEVTTAAFLGSSFAASFAGMGVLSWTAAARASVTDWPSSFTQASGVAISTTTAVPIMELVTTAGASYI